MTLKQLFEEKGYNYYPTDKGTDHSYLDVYDDLFKNFQYSKIAVLEVGIWKGGSLRLWSDYFKNALIFGYDIQDIVAQDIKTERVVTTIKDVNEISPNEFAGVPLTIAIDDGSHLLQDQIAFVKLIYPQLVDGGILIVEDIQNIETQYKSFDTLNIPYEVVDLRSVKGRYDDVLLIFRK